MERRRGGRIGKHTYFPDDLRFDLVLMAFEYLFINENCRTHGTEYSNRAEYELIKLNMTSYVFSYDGLVLNDVIFVVGICVCLFICYRYLIYP